MNIQKHLIPVTVAATIHVALFFAFPAEDYVGPIDISAPKAGSLTPFPPEPAVPVDPEERPEVEPVKSLLGEPPPIALAEPLVPPTTSICTMPSEKIRYDEAIKTDRIPSVIGDPTGVRDGEFRPSESIFKIGMLDRTPRAKAQLPPDYPAEMRHKGMGGSVMVEFDVDTQGRVIRAEAISYTDREFAEPAVRAVRKWRFEPGRRDNKAVPFRMAIPIEFGIENG
jgi:protein TonB